ncbi:hypothetical protein SAMN05428959_101438 [Duganella sp. CF517]|uniref:hypothetical protein n=1 Tax=Duganella sp. CF517 TaxID=1881038 RepID=UPI0008ACE248|nr:hypothetical protein [Duganella sp. CF517]SEN15644.1 hypothetical protein SAMN05428959_101438 [Duganella sp. CF517]
MNKPTTAVPVRPLPLSGLLLALAYAVGMLGFEMPGWALFSAGALTWMMADGRTVVRMLARSAPHHTQRLIAYSTPPAIALLAYMTLAGGQADAVVGGALALHAVLVWALLMGAAYAVSQQTAVSQRI